MTRRPACVAAAVALLCGAIAAGAYEAGPVVDGGSITGQVRYAGPPPSRGVLEVTKDLAACGTTAKLATELVVGPNRGLQWAVVSLQSVRSGKPFATGRPVLDQRRCEYQPHVVLVPAGGELEILNSDEVLHNIHTTSEANPPVNRAQPKFKKSITQRFGSPERIALRCIVHPWMRGWVIVQEHPYFAVTDAHGRFALDGIPPGEYVLQVWHERLGELTRPVSVRAGATVPLDVEMGPG